MVTFPQAPLVDGINEPDGRGGATEEELGGTTIGVDDDEGEGLGEGVGVGVGVGVGSGGASPHRPYSGWHPTISPQNSN